MINVSTPAFLIDHILEQSLDLICTIDREGRIVYVSNACDKMLGYDPQQLTGRVALDMVHPADRRLTFNVAREVASGKTTTTFENRLVGSNGNEVTLAWSSVWSEEKDVFVCIGRDITEQVKAKNEVLEKEDFYQALIEHGSDIITLIDEEGTYKYIGGSSTYKILGYDPEQLIGRNALSLIHPEDLPVVLASLNRVLTQESHVPVSAFRFKHASGEWKWLETIGSNQLDNPSIGAIVVSSRDITEPIQNKLKLKESQQRFKALFDNNPDMVYFENREGIILDVNPAALSFFQSEKVDVVGYPMSAFLPPVAASICDEKRKEALCGSKVTFDLELKVVGHEQLGTIILDITKIPVEINGSIVGIYTIARDVTAIRRSQSTIEQQAKKLSTIFESITDAFFTVDRSFNFTYINKECERLLGIDKAECLGRNILSIFPEEMDGEFHKQYQFAIDTGNAVNFKALLRRSNTWLEVRAFPSAEGLSVYFSNVTERVLAEQELEKLSIVASKTSNGVVIIDEHGLTEWVNEGFTRITGYAAAEIIGKASDQILQGPNTNKAVAQEVTEKMKSGQPYSGELLNYKKSGEEIWISFNLTPVPDESGSIVRYIVILSDITDTIKYRQKLRELSLVASTSTNGIFITNAERQIEWINDGFTRLTGYTSDEVIGRRPSEFLHNEKTATESFLQAKERMYKGEPVSFEASYSTKSGNDIWVSAEVNSVLNEQGVRTRYIGTLTDISALKKSELELTQLTQDLYRHNRDMQQFTYIVSHNLRSPVANAIGLTQLMNKLDKHSEAFDKCLVNLNKSASQLDMMLKDMNTILSVRDVKDRFDQEEVALVQVLQQVEESLREPLENSAATLKVDIAEDFKVTGNRAYLHSIFYNLLSNAIKYRSPERMLVVKLSSQQTDSGETVVSFSDNGSGFDMDKVGKKLFKLYNRFHLGLAEGRGIGLFLVKTHVEAMGGRIEVDSKENSGTTFKIYLK